MVEVQHAERKAVGKDIVSDMTQLITAISGIFGAGGLSKMLLTRSERRRIERDTTVDNKLAEHDRQFSEQKETLGEIKGDVKMVLNHMLNQNK